MNNMQALLIIGILLLLLAIVLNTKLQLKVIDNTCPQDIRAVRTNKIALSIMYIISIVCIILSLVFIL